jgi:hypothetical protein
MDTINIYRLYDPFAIQQMQQSIEAAASIVPLGGFSSGYTTCTVYDNGFWLLENELTEVGQTMSRLGSVEDAVEAVGKFMSNFDVAIGGGKPLRDLNEYEKAFDWNTVHPNYRPAQLREGYKAPKATDNSKPKFFEYASFIGGRSIMYEVDGRKYPYWRLVYGIEVKPSNQENTVMVEDAEIIIEIWASGAMKSISYYFLPVKEIKTEERISVIISNRDAPPTVCYGLDRITNCLVPFIFTN